ncbi:MAG: hypothetical protein MZV63_52770 [Marinilabiliales bacterium]|nr:hypothetical protein [Marinilabiliales bacterium]
MDTAEVVTTNLFPGNWMKYVMDQCVWTDALLTLPDNYTIEFDVIPIGGLEGAGMSGWQYETDAGQECESMGSWLGTGAGRISVYG